MFVHHSCSRACSVSFQEKNYTGGSLAAYLMVGLLPVQEAGPEARFVMGLEYFSPTRATGSRRVLDVQKFHRSLEGRANGSRLDSDAHAISVVRSSGFRNTAWV
ncbi:hypothetical protein GCM10009097_56270 [Pigmentiphaga daeguensis]|uniref:Uncharacterized protein n=1 Tax=Pigmentiphaga daeguensis TaxID=414049 RepID=A0ABP3N1H6_9BURK